MSQTTLVIPIDTEIKMQLDEFCESIGMNVTEVVNIFAKVVLLERRIPFEYVDPDKQTATNSENGNNDIIKNEGIGWVNLLAGIISLPEEDKHKCTRELVTDCLVEDYENLS